MGRVSVDTRAMLPTDVRFTDKPRFGQLVELFVEEYTVRGDLVLDPFAGSGETMATAIRLGRRGLGVEIVPELAADIRARLGSDVVVAGDTRRLDTFGLPPADLVVTSPPFMTVTHHPQNPLSGYLTLDGDYQGYLTELASITRMLGRCVRPGGRIVLDVWNFWHGELFTPLADDARNALADVLPLEHVVDIGWPPDLDRPVEDRCLIYRVPESD